MKTKAYFENIEWEIRNLLLLAKESVKICVAWINGDIYSSIFEKIAKKGVKIEIIYNDDDKNRKNPIKINIDGVYLYPVNVKGAYMHNKFCIIDDETLITGSFNWSINAAEKHFENIVIIKNDYQLVKDYLHEFEDLKSYIYHENEVKDRCDDEDSKCGSTIYNLGILGGENGQYCESVVDIWQICSKNCHAKLISERVENYLSGHLDLNDDSFDEFYEYDKGSMLNDFKKERAEMQNVQNYFKDNHKFKIHALGVVVPINESAFNHYNENLHYEIKIRWRDIYYRKIIPSELSDAEGNIEKIINKHSLNN
jgi:phosphatidylserine/phosphatidylglycerophosphate/cardiolipin synthase-like enzyme